MTRADAYRFFSTLPRNVYRSLSARSADGRIVAITLWRDEFSGPAGRMVYELSRWGDWHRGNCRAFFQDPEQLWTEGELKAALVQAGFREINPIWRNLMFVGMLALK